MVKGLDRCIEGCRRQLQALVHCVGYRAVQGYREFEGSTVLHTDVQGGTL